MSDFTAARTPWYKHLLLSLGVTAAIVAFFPRVFLENDDLGFIYLLSHGFYAPWVSKPLCGLLMQLYGAFPSLGWYGLLHYAILALDLGVLFKLSDDWAVENQLSPKLRRWLLLAGGLLFLPFILRITFTCSSILSGGLGLLAFLAIFKRPVSQWRWGWAFGAGVVFSLCYLVRPEAMGAMLFLLPAVSVALLACRQAIVSPKGLGVLVAFLLPFLIAVGVDQKIMRYPAAQTPYLNYVVTSNDVFGFGYTEQFKTHPEWLALVGWSRTDYGMLERFLYWDETVFSQQKMDQLSAMAPMAIKVRVLNVLNPGMLFNRMWKTFAKTWLSNYPFTLYCLGLFALFSMMGITRLSRRFPALMLGFLFMGSVLMQAILRFPYRVAYPVIIVSSLSMLALPGYAVAQLKDTMGRLKRAAKIALGLTVVCLLIFNGPVRIIKTLRAPLPDTRAKLAELNRIQANHYILREAGVIQISASDPLDPAPLKYPDIGPGWLIQSIPYYQRLQAFGVSQGSELLPVAFNNPRFLFFFKDKNLPFLQKYIQAHYGKRAQFTPVDNVLHTTFYKNSHLYRLTVSDIPNS